MNDEKKPEAQNVPAEANARKAEIVAIPVDVFAVIVEKLSEQPYREVGSLLNTLAQYRPQTVTVQAQ